MLNLDVSESVRDKWGKAIDRNYALHLGGFLESIRAVNFLVEEIPLSKSTGVLYRCQLSVVPKNGHTLKHVVDREDCGAAIEHSFAKAKRMLQRKVRGLSSDMA